MTSIFDRNVFGQNVLLKRIIMSAVTAGFYPMFRWRHRLTIKGADRLKTLPRNGILFVSNHQTYFTDGICMHLIFSATLSGYDHPADGVRHLMRPHESFYYVAASETMTSGVFPRILAYGSAVCVKRSWKEGERVVERDVDVEGFHNVGRAIRDGWVVTFPQGTTRPFAPGRIGTAHLIRTFKPIVVPVVLNGFHEAFGKTGLDFSRPAGPLRVEFKAPLQLDYDAEPREILAQVMDAIEQSEAHGQPNAIHRQRHG